MGFLFEEETYKVIGAAQKVHQELGTGFLEIVYQDALEIEFQRRSIPYKREYLMAIYYIDVKLNRTFNTDFLRLEKIIIETKATKSLTEGFYAQTFNYLKATKLRLALLINFGEPQLKVKRIIR